MRNLYTFAPPSGIIKIVHCPALKEEPAMHFTGKTFSVALPDRTLTLCNQDHPDWTEPYAYQVNGATLRTSGCGIFSIVHASQWMTGAFRDPAELVAFAMACGGRGDDGTDRPVLLRAMMQRGLAAAYGFSYGGEDLRNDLDALYAHLSAGRGCALCNLRPGHIVALCAARRADGIFQVLAMDSAVESALPAVRDAVCEVLPESRVVKPVYNKNGLLCGEESACAMYWARLDTVRDFNLLHAL